MAIAGFTRDEVILALDVLYSSGNSRITASSQEIRDLSALLIRLPIYPVEDRKSYFRNPNGVSQQLKQFEKCIRIGKRNPHVGAKFFEVASEYEDRYDELHAIAEAIRYNESNFTSCFGSPMESSCFPEGALLGHLHKVIEARDGKKLLLNDHCEVCCLQPSLYYQFCGPILQQHLLVPPTQMEGGKSYGANCFITVCPNCHEALHNYRPWLTRDNLSEILH